jgi:hypothetical protein
MNQMQKDLSELKQNLKAQSKNELIRMVMKLIVDLYIERSKNEKATNIPDNAVSSVSAGPEQATENVQA